MRAVARPIPVVLPRGGGSGGAPPRPMHDVCTPGRLSVARRRQHPKRETTMGFSLMRAASLLVVAFGANCTALAENEKMTAGRIHIEYVAPKNPEHEALYYQLMLRMSLEKIRAIFEPFRLPRDVTIRTVGCDGERNAWYQPIDGRPTVTVCYEYLYELWAHLPTMVTNNGPTPTDALVGQMLFAFAHEFGHLVFDVYEIPVFGREEDAADNFATFLMLQSRGDGPRLIMGAAWSYHTYISDWRQKPKATLPLAAFSSNHGQPEERFYNMQCIAYGSDPKVYAGLVERGFLPESRAKNCKYEYDVLKFAFDKQVFPHIDMELAAKVMMMDWLATAQAPRALR